MVEVELLHLNFPLPGHERKECALPRSPCYMGKVGCSSLSLLVVLEVEAVWRSHAWRDDTQQEVREKMDLFIVSDSKLRTMTVSNMWTQLPRRVGDGILPRACELAD